MRVRSLLSLVTVSLISGSAAWAGTRDGGGGAAAVCRDEAGKITSVRMLDLYEQEVTGAIRVTRLDLPVEKLIHKALGRLDPFIAYNVSEMVAHIQAKTDMLPPNLNLHKKYDLGDDPILMEDGCVPEWVAFDEDGIDSRLKVVTKLHRMMSPTDQAALLLHEAIYEFGRVLNENLKDSLSTRRLVAQLFSDHFSKARTDELSAFIRLPSTKSLAQVWVQGSPKQFVLEVTPLEVLASESAFYVELACYDIRNRKLDSRELSMAIRELNGPQSLVVSGKCRELRINYSAYDNRNPSANFVLKADGQLLFSGDLGKAGHPVNALEYYRCRSSGATNCQMELVNWVFVYPGSSKH